jgi:hypothetical protein
MRLFGSVPVDVDDLDRTAGDPGEREGRGKRDDVGVAG